MDNKKKRKRALDSETDLKQEIDKQKDPEIKAELKKGNIVTIFESSLD